MKRGLLRLVVVSCVAWGVWASAERAGAQTARNPNIDAPAAYVATIGGRIGWDFTPDLLMNIFLDADRTFGDLVPVLEPKPGEADMVVHPDAWTHHPVVLRLNLGLDERATHLDLGEHLTRFRAVLGEQMNLRNRRVVLWVQRADDLAALLLADVPEVFLVPGARATLSEPFVERFAPAGGEPPEAPDLGQFATCATMAELFEALGLPEETAILTGDSLKILERWAQFRDETLEMARRAVGEQWEEFVRITNDSEEPAYRKISARRDISSALRSAHLRIVRYEDLAGHPMFVPLEDDLLDKTKRLSEMPHPQAR